LAVTVDGPESESTSGAGVTVEEAHPRSRVLVALALAVVLLFAAVVVLGIRVVGAYSDRNRDAAITAVAREAVEHLLTIDQGDGKRTMDTLMDESSGDFKQQLIAQTDAFSQGVQDAKVNSQGAVTESAIQLSTDEHAVLLVTANATVKNTVAPNGVERQYRIVMELQRQDGTPWTVSKLEMAP
jgi:Mce-associated membrane protein